MQITGLSGPTNTERKWFLLPVCARMRARERERERECKQTESRKTDLNLRKYFLHLSHAQDAQVKLVQIKTSVNNFWLRTVWSELVVCSIFGHLQQSKFTQKYLKIAKERSNLYSNAKLNVKDFAQDKKLCQSFSKSGHTDEGHLWRHWLNSCFLHP